MSAGLLGPVLCLPLWLLEEADFFDLLFELFCRDEDCLFFFLGLTVEEERHGEEAEVQINMYNAAVSLMKSIHIQLFNSWHFKRWLETFPGHHDLNVRLSEPHAWIEKDNCLLGAPTPLCWNF